MIKKLNVISKICVIVFTFIFGVILVGSEMALNRINELSTYFGQARFELIAGSGGDGSDSIYYDSDFTSVKDVKAAGEDIAEEAALEGAVLLKNEKNALPLSQGDKVNLYSMSSYDPIYSGTGDQGRAYENLNFEKNGNINKIYDTHMLDAFNDAGLDVNEQLFNWYKNNYNTYGRKNNNKTLRQTGNAIYKQYTIADASWDNISTPAKEQAAEAGIFVLSRIAGEGSDLTLRNIGMYPGDMTHGNHLKLSPTEQDVLDNMKIMKAAGKLKKIIIVLNFSNQVELDFLDDDAFDAAIWVGNFGQRGPEALARLLLGEVSPSGKLVDTFWKQHYYNPVLSNFGNAMNDKNSGTFEFANKDQFKGQYGQGAEKYVVYQEGIYLGYKYTETRYEDKVLERANVGDYNYSDVVSYPFGYGLSYTNFEYSDYTVKKNAMSYPISYNVSVKVKNSGSVSGKEVVQFYLQKPYTQYDIDNNVEKSAVEIVGYAKTKELKPGESQVLEYSIGQNYFASYDAYGAGTYILNDGDYYITAAPDSHTAVNNILLQKKGDTIKKSASWYEMNGRTSNGALVYKENISKFDDKIYSKSLHTGVDIVNQFDSVDILTNKSSGQQNKDAMTYITRNNWNGTVKLAWSDYETGTWASNEVKLTMNADLAKDSLLPELKKDDIPYPTMNADNGLSLIDLQSEHIEYNDPLWEKLLDQMSWDEMCTLIANGHGGTQAIASINKVKTYDMDSAVGVSEWFDSSSSIQSFSKRYDDPDKHTKSTSYTGNDTVAAAYNDDLSYRIGKQWGEDCLWIGYTALYGPGVNIHRTPFSGRNYNYFSEDGFMTGKPSAQMTLGMKSKGGEALIKHVGLNEQETNRIAGTTFANEQSVREIYMRGPELTISEGKAQGVMASLARMGMEYCGHQGFFKNVIRGEFGATGYNVSDTYFDFYMSAPVSVLMGQGLPLSGGEKLENSLKINSEGYGEFANALREECHRVLYTVVHSNAMNFQAPGMKVIIITPPWIKTLNAIKTTSIVLFAASVAFGVGMIVINKCPNLIKFKKKSKQ